MRGWMVALSACLGMMVMSSYAVDDQVGELWQRMQVAAHQLNYEATLIMVSHRRVSTLRRVHVRVGGHEWQRLVSLDGERREVQAGQGMAMLFEGNGLATLMQGQEPTAATMNPSPLPMTFYITNLRLHRRVGGRSSRELLLQPRDTWRYGLNLWVDDATGLLLRAEVTQGGHRLLVLSVTGLQVGPEVGLSEYKRAARHGSVLTHPMSQAPCLPWSVQLPPGFQQVKIHHKAINGAMVDEARYSDGLASVSVFVTKAPAVLPQYQQPRLHHWGAMTTAEQWRQGGKNSFLVSVLGNVPARTVLQMLSTWQVAVSPTCAKHY
ncbi:MAG: hypothetical protein HKM02_12445 [Pseudomonadales bacterium]|nr:hypothetical protein [Pseudomonadales bacterium]